MLIGIPLKSLLIKEDRKMKKRSYLIFLVTAWLFCFTGLAGSPAHGYNPHPGPPDIRGVYQGQGTYITSSTIAPIDATVTLTIDQQSGYLFTERLGIIGSGEITGGQQFTISGYFTYTNATKKGDIQISGSLFTFPFGVRVVQKLEARGQIKGGGGTLKIGGNYLVSSFDFNAEIPPVDVIQFSGDFNVERQLAQ